MIDDPQAVLITYALQLARVMPYGTLQTLAETIGQEPSARPTDLWRRVRAMVPQPQLRALVLELFNAWQSPAAHITPSEVAMALRTAARAVKMDHEAQMVELVWTGPLMVGTSMRRTDQALLELITHAQQSLLIVSFAVYKIPAIAAALVQAAQRGVRIRICIEAPEPSGQQLAYDTIKALGTKVTQRAAVYVWPNDQRPRDPNGHIGVLHAKCASADGQLLFLSSANLTDYAMNLNIELGVLMHSTLHANRVVAQFEQLIAQGILQRVSPNM